MACKNVHVFISCPNIICLICHCICHYTHHYYRLLTINSLKTICRLAFLAAAQAIVRAACNVGCFGAPSAACLVCNQPDEAFKSGRSEGSPWNPHRHTISPRQPVWCLCKNTDFGGWPRAQAEVTSVAAVGHTRFGARHLNSANMPRAGGKAWAEQNSHSPPCCGVPQSDWLEHVHAPAFPCFASNKTIQGMVGEWT